MSEPEMYKKCEICGGTLHTWTFDDPETGCIRTKTKCDQCGARPSYRPDEIQVLSTKFKIKWLTEAEAQDHGKFGFMSPQSQTIAIQESLNPTKMADTFLHELLHAILWLTRSYTFLKNVKEPMEIEEYLCGSLSSALQAVIIQNPRVFRWYNDLIYENSKASQQ